VATLKFLRTLAPLGAVLALVCASSAQAAGGTAVTVRVEGKSRALLAPTVVHLKSGWITRGGAPVGVCSKGSAAGALDQATHHRWGGPYKSSQTDYAIFSILGETHNFTLKTTTMFWEIFVDNVSATTGACGITPHRGDQLLFAAVPEADYGDYPLAITGAPRHASVGHAFKVKVLYYNALGKARPLAGAVVTGGGQTAMTNAHGVATLTPAKAGRLVLTATHADTHKGGHPYGYIRAAAVRVTVD
jgi:hypothetical protein